MTKATLYVVRAKKDLRVLPNEAHASDIVSGYYQGHIHMTSDWSEVRFFTCLNLARGGAKWSPGHLFVEDIDEYFDILPVEIMEPA